MHVNELLCRVYCDVPMTIKQGNAAGCGKLVLKRYGFAVICKNYAIIV